jgi:pimeloyl-ACP methyl ester carboxylesterase
VSAAALASWAETTQGLPPPHELMLPGGPVACRIAGQGPPLVLLHGWGASSRCWGETFRRLGSCFTLIAPDLPGFGASPPLADAATNTGLAGLTLGIADALGLERFALNGHSYCAGVAAIVATRAPARVERLVLTCFSVWRNAYERLIVASVHRLLGLYIALRAPWQARRRFFQRALARRLFYKLPSDADLLRAGYDDFLQMDRRVALSTAASAARPPFHSLLRAVEAPTLLIGARQDTVMPPANTPRVAQLIPNCQLRWIERCGHMPMIERPEIYHPLLRDFLS